MADQNLYVELQSGVFVPKRLVDTGDGYYAEKTKASITDFPALSSASDSVSLEGQVATYSATLFFTPDSTSSSQDIFGIEASSTMVVRLLRVRLWPRQTTASMQLIFMLKRATFNTGTSVVVNALAHRSTDPAATATVRNWTTKPTTLGTNLGGPVTTRLVVPAAGSVTQGETVVVWTPPPGGRWWTLEANSTQAWYVQWFGAMPAGGIVDAELTWTESAA